jgi:hypothetical protein
MVLSYFRGNFWAYKIIQAFLALEAMRLSQVQDFFSWLDDG